MAKSLEDKEIQQHLRETQEALMKVAEEMGNDTAGPATYLDVRRLVQENQRLREEIETLKSQT